MIRLAATGAALCALVGLGLWLHIPGEIGVGSDDAIIAFALLAVLAGLVHAAGLLPMRGRRLPAAALGLVLIVALGMRVAAVAHPPFLSSDIYRYVWDGRVQVAGQNPYAFLPNAPELAGLRDEAIYPHINRFDYAPTIYPPAAQALFAAVAAVWPTIWGMKTAIALCDLGAIGVLLAVLRLAGRPGWEVALYAWHPLPVWEFAGNGHIDGAGLLFTAVAVWAAIRSRPGAAGAALAVAALCKFLPLAVAPALWRRWDFRAPLAGAAVVAVGYAAYIGAGWRVLGFLPGYTQEEGLGNGSGFFVLRAGELFGNWPRGTTTIYLVLGLLLLAALAIVIAFRPWPVDQAARVRTITGRALLLATAVVALLSPHYPWYIAPLAWFACIRPWPSVVWLTLSAPLLYLDEQHDAVVWPAIIYIPFAFLALRDAIVKERA